MISYSICFSVWLISLTIIPPSPSTLLQMVTFFFFWQSNTPLCVYIYVCVYMYTHPPHVLIVHSGRSCLGHCDWCCCSHSCSGFFWIYAQEKTVGSCFFFFFLRKHHIVFHRGCTALCSHKDHKLSKTDLNSNPGFLSSHGQMSERAT